MCTLFIVFAFHIFCDILFKCVSNDVFSVCLFSFCLFFFNYLVTWTGNFSLLAWLAISVCCKISEVRRFFRQPAAWHVSLFGTTGYFVCRGNKCILFNVHNYSRNCICRQYDTEMSRTLCQKTDSLNSWLLHIRGVTWRNHLSSLGLCSHLENEGVGLSYRSDSFKFSKVRSLVHFMKHNP